MSKQTSRVIHVPLTDKEWRDLRTYAVIGETTIGRLAADALRNELRIQRPTTGRVTK